MRYSKDVGFATVHRNKKISPTLTRQCKRAYEKNKNVFREEPDQFRIYVYDNLQRLNNDLQPEVRGAAGVTQNNGDIQIQSSELLTRLKHLDTTYFPKFLTHEMTHVFWKNNFNGWKPKWLAEGLAHHIADTFTWLKKYGYKLSQYGYDHTILDYRFMFKKQAVDMNKKIMKHYIWRSFTDYLVEKHSLTNVMDFLYDFYKNPVRKNYDNLFKTYFNNTEKELYDEFMMN
ncbi:MAG: hypothetical protein ACLFTH_03870 [Candidatus Woesearchaeota archaeon]